MVPEGCALCDDTGVWLTDRGYGIVEEPCPECSGLDPLDPYVDMEPWFD